MIAFIAAGSNLGDRYAHLDFAYRQLQCVPGVVRARTSPLYESVAIGPGVQPDYLNAVFEIGTTLSPGELLCVLQTLEHDAGRVRGERWAARTLDLDLLLHGTARQQDEMLTLPHPRLTERNFVIYPLFDLAPGLRLPDGTGVAELRHRLAPDGLRPAGIPLGGGHAHA